ncbi:hypothetical protein Q7267_08015 [Glaesserella parasuis]|uniref:Uncharacterized protein n=2 Tax=Glaesserella parasuis TaxID=738 RepID=A0A084EX55_GLAPU|nr:hypothetical protein [Glaesserella parasuis]KDB46232.1 hypothetical protein HPS10_08285 [Glaesserella parasuis HPS10]KEZ22547.1 hypothetical protein HS327_01119 [Glaesserella parasuis]MCT8534077.1 hypothetical protein [Glaesserella parasuis]MCT8540828.1 hypothetical protein [Glaesserella parasuis]MCT8542808.1 hypothetical protein [Glaesserella parasuis]
MNPTQFENISMLNPERQFAKAIVAQLTKDQLKTLKSRLQFDPRKLPLTFQALETALQTTDEATFNTLRTRYFQLIDEFQKLVEPSQIDALQGYATYISQLIEQTDDDFLLDDLETLHGHLLNFFESVNTR